MLIRTQFRTTGNINLNFLSNSGGDWLYKVNNPKSTLLNIYQFDAPSLLPGIFSLSPNYIPHLVGSEEIYRKKVLFILWCLYSTENVRKLYLEKTNPLELKFKVSTSREQTMKTVQSAISSCKSSCNGNGSKSTRIQLFVLLYDRFLNQFAPYVPVLVRQSCLEDVEVLFFAVGKMGWCSGKCGNHNVMI